MIPKAYAVVDISDPDVNPAAQFSNIAKLLNVVLPAIMIAGALIFLAMLLYGAFSYTTSSGDQERVQKARKTITYSIGGIVLIMVSYLLVSLLSIITGIGLPH